MSRYTNAERMALTPTEDVILDVDAQWDLAFEEFEKQDNKQEQDNKRAKNARKQQD